MNKHKDRIYLTFNYPGYVPGSKTLLTGIRGNGKTLYITGFYEPPESRTISFLYKGDLRGTTGICSNNSWNKLDYPESKATNLYGPLILDCDNVRAVGNYTKEETDDKDDKVISTGNSGAILGKESVTIGCMYEGKLDGSGKWTILTPTSDTINTIAHSTMGDLVVGNYDTILIQSHGTRSDNPLSLSQGKAFIYDVKTKKFYNIEKEGTKSITAYGIWHNGGNSYTICGGLSYDNPDDKLDTGYLVDWNNKTHEFSNWRDYYYADDKIKSLVTHFDGITSDGNGGYNLTGDAITLSEGTIAFFVNINKFNDRIWQEIEFPESMGTSGNSVYKDIVIGVYKDTDDDAATVNGYISIVL